MLLFVRPFRRDFCVVRRWRRGEGRNREGEEEPIRPQMHCLILQKMESCSDERAINTKRVLNPWERNENHTLGLNSAKAIGCTVVNIGTQDLIEGRAHLVLGLISQIIKIQLLADLNLKKAPQLLELVEDEKDVEELISLPPDKVLLKWMNFHSMTRWRTAVASAPCGDRKGKRQRLCCFNFLHG